MAAPACRVFGKPITDGTRSEKALAAKNSPNAGRKLDQALQFINLQQQKAAAAVGQETGTTRTTFGGVYNATGETITYKIKHNWEGDFSGKDPVDIQNGQWAVFEHVGTLEGSVGAIVYDTKDFCGLMISWNNPWKKRIGSNSNTAYCEMNYSAYFEDCDWDVIHKRLMASGTECHKTYKGYSTKVTIAEGKSTSSFIAYFNLDE